MLYYRYRPGTPLSMKELVYNEMYFSSVSECNDPYEGALFAKFENNSKHWKRLADLAFSETLKEAYPCLTEKFAEYMISMPPKTINEFFEFAPQNLCYQILSDEKLNEDKKIEFMSPLIEALFQVQCYVEKHLPPEQYFVSFSKKRDDLLMWSHYANNHRGYCLIFHTDDNKIRQNKLWAKTEFKFESTSSVLSDDPITFNVNESFKLQNVKYINEPKNNLNAFMLFPNVIYPEHSTKEIDVAMNNAYNQSYKK